MNTRARDPLAVAGHLEYDRILFFNDAVFAIAITLLVVDLRPPDPNVYSGQALREAVPGIVGFAISFAVIGLFWMGHHAIFRYVTAFDRGLIMLNLLFLGTIAFLPYPTELRRYFLLRILRVPAVFLVSIPVAVVRPGLAAYLWILIWVTDQLLRRRAPVSPEDPGQV